MHFVKKTMVTDTVQSKNGPPDTPQAGSQILVEEFEGDQQVLPHHNNTLGITLGVGWQWRGKGWREGGPGRWETTSDPPPSATCLYRSMSGSVTDTLTDTFLGPRTKDSGPERGANGLGAKIPPHKIFPKILIFPQHTFFTKHR